MLSLTARLTIAASVILLAFVGLTGFTLDRAFHDSALSAVEERLQAQVYILLGAAVLDTGPLLRLPEALPEARFSTPGSGLYAEVLDSEGRPVWRSPSMLGLRLAPLPQPQQPGIALFTPTRSANGEPLFALSFAVSWEIAPERYRRYVFRVAESQGAFREQVTRFRRGLWFWLLAGALMLLAAQVLVLRWSLRPLHRVARQVTEIESGRRERLSGPYPNELKPLADNLNTLLDHSRAHLERYRNALGDLAHSLKTPLAVLHGALGTSDAKLRDSVASQVERMNQTVDYQLQRAAASGRIALTAPLEVAAVARKVIDSLSKVYAERKLSFELAIEGDARFYGDEGDLMEILGNLADNACKWAERRVRIRASKNRDLLLCVEDDGPGIAADQQRRILNRGQRADHTTPGHGIGLAVVRDIVEDVYRGRLEIASSAWGGARLSVYLPAPD